MFTFTFLFAQAQKADEINSSESDVIPVVSTFKTIAYVDGKRLDSIDASYAQFIPRGVDEVYFDYGQRGEKKDLLLQTTRVFP